ncbi:hypothetical protein INT47_006256 [Mucor saturninus]|uniref:C2 domain-containing protein n=1 Tax=Mucor saturninus TaxID=64648 RepID=A0A8H7R074_9FUNG|nr:hypothetical protein INT47_006256 [Mucor saturninus]
MRSFLSKKNVEYKLSINILKATNLETADKNGLSDPYAILYIDGKERARTEVKKETLNPKWSEQIIFPLDMKKQMRLIEIWVWDKDGFRDKCRDVFKKKTFSDDFLGKIEIPVEKLFKTFNLSKKGVDFEQFIELSKPLLKNHEDDNVKGEIVLEVGIVAMDGDNEA